MSRLLIGQKPSWSYCLLFVERINLTHSFAISSTRLTKTFPFLTTGPVSVSILGEWLGNFHTRLLPVWKHNRQLTVIKSHCFTRGIHAQVTAISIRRADRCVSTWGFFFLFFPKGENDWFKMWFQVLASNKMKVQGFLSALVILEVYFSGGLGWGAGGCWASNSVFYGNNSKIWAHKPCDLRLNGRGDLTCQQSLKYPCPALITSSFSSFLVTFSGKVTQLAQCWEISALFLIPGVHNAGS